MRVNRIAAAVTLLGALIPTVGCNERPISDKPPVVTNESEDWNEDSERAYVDWLAKGLKSKNGHQRLVAIEKLGESGVAPAVKALTDAFGGNPDFSEPIIRALGVLGYNAKYKELKTELERRAVPLLIGFIDNKDQERYFRYRAVEALGYIGSPKANAALAYWLVNDDHSLIRQNAAFALGQIGSKESLLPLCNAFVVDKNDEVAKAVLDAFVKIPGDKERAVPFLADALASIERRNMMESLVAAVDEVKQKDSVVELLLSKKLTSNNLFTLENAARALGLLKATKATTALISLLNDPRDNIRHTVAEALGNIGDKTATKPLCDRLLTEEKYWVQEAIVKALGTLKDELAEEPLLKFLNHDDADMRKKVVWALGEIGQECSSQTCGEDKAEFITRALVERLKFDDALYVRIASAKALGKICDPCTLSDLEAMKAQLDKYQGSKDFKEAVQSVIDVMKARP